MIRRAPGGRFDRARRKGLEKQRRRARGWEVELEALEVSSEGDKLGRIKAWVQSGDWIG
jgi:hypothetical protein